MNTKKLLLRIVMLVAVLAITAGLNQPVQAVTGCAVNTTICIQDNPDGTAKLGHCSSCYCVLTDGTRFYDPIDCSAPIP